MRLIYETREVAIPVRPVATEFALLLQRNQVSGFIALVRPTTFGEACAEQRVWRLVEEPNQCGRCGAPTADGWRCSNCKISHNAYTTELRRKRLAAGQCRYCGDPAPCQKCAGRANEGSRELRARRRANGRCELCLEPSIKGGYCIAHRPGRLAASRVREANKRLARKAAVLCANCGREAPNDGYTRCELCKRMSKASKAARRNKL
jgi:hypothetical protein